MDLKRTQIIRINKTSKNIKREKLNGFKNIKYLYEITKKRMDGSQNRYKII